MSEPNLKIGSWELGVGSREEEKFSSVLCELSLMVSLAIDVLMPTGLTQIFF